MSTLISPVIDPVCPTTAAINAALAAITAAHNTLCVQVNALTAGGVSLSGLVDQATFNAHKAALCPHPGMVKVPGLECQIIECLPNVTIPAGGLAAVVFPTALPSGQVPYAIMPHVVGTTPVSVAVSAITNIGLNVSATAGSVVSICIIRKV